MSKTEGNGIDLPNYGPTDYTKFFGAGALAATLTHGVRLEPISPSIPSTMISLESRG